MFCFAVLGPYQRNYRNQGRGRDGVRGDVRNFNTVLVVLVRDVRLVFQMLNSVRARGIGPEAEK